MRWGMRGRGRVGRDLPAPMVLNQVPLNLGAGDEPELAKRTLMDGHGQLLHSCDSGVPSHTCRMSSAWLSCVLSMETPMSPDQCQLPRTAGLSPGLTLGRWDWRSGDCQTFDRQRCSHRLHITHISASPHDGCLWVSSGDAVTARCPNEALTTWRRGFSMTGWHVWVDPMSACPPAESLWSIRISRSMPDRPELFGVSPGRLFRPIARTRAVREEINSQAFCG
jgi:hypothetical protein